MKTWLCNLSMWQHKARSLCTVNFGSVQGWKVEVTVSVSHVTWWLWRQVESYLWCVTVAAWTITAHSACLCLFQGRFVLVCFYVYRLENINYSNSTGKCCNHTGWLLWAWMSCEGKSGVKNKPNIHQGLDFQQWNLPNTSSHLQFFTAQRSEEEMACVFLCSNNSSSLLCQRLVMHTEVSLWLNKPSQLNTPRACQEMHMWIFLNAWSNDKHCALVIVVFLLLFCTFSNAVFWFTTLWKKKSKLRTV